MVKSSEPLPIDSRHRILDAARAEFSEKGFDGARVDSIAQRADVNKALIYYYFKSKDELLQELLRQFLEERRAAQAAVPNDPTGPTLPDSISRLNVDFLFEKRDILRIALMEDLKSSGQGALLEHWLEGMGAARDHYASQGYGFRLTPRVLTNLYFLHFLPTLAYAVLSENFAKALDVPHDQIREEFLKLVQETNHSQFHSVFADSMRDPSPEVRLPGVTAPAPAKPPQAPQDHFKTSAAERQKLVAKHMSDGRLKVFPLKEKVRLALVEHISALFEPGKIYTEKQVDTLLKGVADDHTKVRRLLIDYGYLNRKPDGSQYWTWDGKSQ